MDNADRAARAARAIDSQKEYEPNRAGMVDLLTDLLHLADLEQMDIDKFIQSARNHHKEEGG